MPNNTRAGVSGKRARQPGRIRGPGHAGSLATLKTPVRVYRKRETAYHGKTPDPQQKPSSTSRFCTGNPGMGITTVKGKPGKSKNPADKREKRRWRVFLLTKTGYTDIINEVWRKLGMIPGMRSIRCEYPRK
jgi:hypothetical protein